jgi:hypothetical protein
MSTAEIAVAATPGRPALRTAATMACQAPRTSSTPRPCTSWASFSLISASAAAAP